MVIEGCFVISLTTLCYNYIVQGMKTDSKNLVWTLIALAILFVLLWTARKPEGLGRRGDQEPKLSEAEIIRSLTAQASSVAKPIDPEILKSLIAPPTSNPKPLDPEILKSLTAPRK